MKNYIALGMYLAYRGDREVPTEDRKRMGDLVGARVRDVEGKLDLMNAPKLEDLVAYCQAVKTKKKCFINLMGTDTEAGRTWMELMEKALAKEGKRQWDAPPTPNHKDLRIALDGGGKKTVGRRRHARHTDEGQTKITAFFAAAASSVGQAEGDKTNRQRGKSSVR